MGLGNFCNRVAVRELGPELVFLFLRPRAAHTGGQQGAAQQPGLITLVVLFAYTLTGPVRGERRRLCLELGAGAMVVLVATCLFLWRIGSLAGFMDEAWLYNVQRFLIGYWQTPAGLISSEGLSIASPLESLRGET